jgi:phospholipase D1/2
LRWPLRLLIAAVLVAAALWTHQAVDLSLPRLVAWLQDLTASQGALGPLLFVVLCVVGMVLHAPQIPIVAAGGIAFGKIAVVYGWLGVTLGAAAMFLLTRLFLREVIRDRFIMRFQRLAELDDRLERHGFLTVLGLRLVFFLAPPLNPAMGASRVRFPDFLAGTALGIVPGMLLTVSFADHLATLQSWRDLFSPSLLVAALLLAALLIVSSVAGRRLMR